MKNVASIFGSSSRDPDRNLTGLEFHDRTRSTMRARSAIQSQPKATLPADTRVYCVGDIHGRADLLMETLGRIDDDQRRRPIRYAIEVYLGDYVDRGPDSRDVIDLLAVRLVRNRAVCLRGNHEALLEAFLAGSAELEAWLPLGALPTLASYGASPRSRTGSAAELRRSLADAFPRTHRLFLQCLRNSFCCGDFMFVHAGVRPDVPIDAQDPRDLLWIRDEFLGSTRHHGKFIVHGHTPVPHPDFHDNRINIDTGAWRTGTLTCIAIEGTQILVL
jgi:serine/threonine protein phosphatase 1